MTDHCIQVMAVSFKKLGEVVTDGIGITEFVAAGIGKLNGRFALVFRGGYILNIIGG